MGMRGSASWQLLWVATAEPNVPGYWAEHEPLMQGPGECLGMPSCAAERCEACLHSQADEAGQFCCRPWEQFATVPTCRRWH